MTLAEIVSDYITRYRSRGRDEARFFAALTDLNESISHAVRPHGRKHDHQYRIPSASLDLLVEKLLRIATNLANAADFEELHGLVAREAVSIFKVGELTIYDVAHRIGMHLRKEPQLIHLHRGTREGAATLGYRGDFVDPRSLPTSFSRLTAAEAEDCLCIYKDDLSGAPGTRSRPTNSCRSGSSQSRSQC